MPPVNIWAFPRIYLGYFVCIYSVLNHLRKRGIAASGWRKAEKSALLDSQVANLVRRDFGWPRYSNKNGGTWNSNYIVPTEWNAYERRQRRFRTATDSALTQSNFFGGTVSAEIQEKKDKGLITARDNEITAAALHPDLQMHAAIAETIIDEIVAAESKR